MPQNAQHAPQASPPRADPGPSRGHPQDAPAEDVLRAGRDSSPRLAIESARSAPSGRSGLTDPQLHIFAPGGASSPPPTARATVWPAASNARSMIRQRLPLASDDPLQS